LQPLDQRFQITIEFGSHRVGAVGPDLDDQRFRGVDDLVHLGYLLRQEKQFTARAGLFAYFARRFRFVFVTFP